MLRVKDQGRTKEEPRNDLRTPKQKMCCLLRLCSKRVDLIPKKVDSFPEIVYLSVSQQKTPYPLKVA